MRYRVTNRASSYFGMVGTALTDEEVAEVQANHENRLGRNPKWYAYWEVLLDFYPMGVGFMLDELEPVS